MQGRWYRTMNQDSSEQTKGRAGPPGGRRGPETHRHCGKTAEPPAAAGTSQGLTSGRPCTGRLMPRSHLAQGQEEGALTAPTSEAQQVKQPAAQQSGVWTPTSGPPGPGPDSSASLSTPEPASACPPPESLPEALMQTWPCADTWRGLSSPGTHVAPSSSRGTTSF